ncbi:hypothetical protein [Halalkalicoccus sp. NIPERK01]|uniref:hypothetical protein n=1 Tax=Halalkalicoccus sp. NIPERK01 TaxID=3053469 RepID=UPI00256ECD9D|nr:hypothetical protein [Halalkalicoccus sp. NIPERK01]MDL5361857.1 hypothetical protein [Halalkalicoccus sp. NIPERK01]
MEGHERFSVGRRAVLRAVGGGITTLGIAPGIGVARPEGSSPEIVWDRTYGSTGPAFSVDTVQDAVETPAGYAFTGRSAAAGGGWLVLVDPADGDVLSTWVYPDLYPDALVAADDGGYLVAGRASNEFGAPAVAVGIDADGEELWREFYGTTELGVSELIRTTDGGFAMIGVGVDAEERLDFALVKAAVDGTEEWSRTYGGEGSQVGRSLVETTDGGFVLAGFTTSDGFDRQDAWLVRVDAEGEAVWSETYGERCTDEASSIVRTDGGFVFLGTTRSSQTDRGDADLWLVGVDAAGAERWTGTYGDLDGTTFDNVGGHSGTLVACEDGYAFIGSIDGRFGLGRVDGAGHTRWLRTISKGSAERFQSDHPTELLATSDGGYLLAGLTGIPSGAFNARLVKLQ